MPEQRTTITEFRFITLKPKTPMICSTSGDGYWSRQKRAVTTPKIEMEVGEVKETPRLFASRLPRECPQMHIHIKAYFTKKTWSNGEHGLIYTDSQWLKDFRKQFASQFPTLAWIANVIDYTEQGMQGANYVSLELSLPNMESIKRFLEITDTAQRQSNTDEAFDKIRRGESAVIRLTKPR